MTSARVTSRFLDSSFAPVTLYPCMNLTQKTVKNHEQQIRGARHLRMQMKSHLGVAGDKVSPAGDDQWSGRRRGLFRGVLPVCS